jgi:hypothetical protein
MDGRSGANGPESDPAHHQSSEAAFMDERKNNL